MGLMGLFKKKIKVIKKIEGKVWGHLITDHGVDVDTLYNKMRCVEREGVLEGKQVTFLRVFKPMEAEQRGIDIMGWETFDQHPDLILFEGYLTKANTAHLERKN